MSARRPSGSAAGLVLTCPVQFLSSLVRTSSVCLSSCLVFRCACGVQLAACLCKCGEKRNDSSRRMRSGEREKGGKDE
ncbi:hypothetical protein CSPX01_00532 [Colletotrichum filicis]|nr:hypothetical protein CSPX01_00532 [Colletotrichum filicis]